MIIILFSCIAIILALTMCCAMLLIKKQVWQRRCNDNRRFVNALLRGFGNVILLANNDGIIIFANNQLEKLVGYKIAEIVKRKKWIDLFAPASAKIITKTIEELSHRFANYSTTKELRIITKNGQSKDVVFRLARIFKAKRTIISIQDNTRIKEHEKKFVAEYNYYRSLIDLMNLAVVNMDLDYNVVFVNDRAKEMLDVGAKDTDSKKGLFKDCFRKSDWEKVDVNLHFVVQKNKSFTDKMVMLNKDKQEFPAQIVVVKYNDSKLSCIIRDCSEIQDVEDLKTSQENQAAVDNLIVDLSNYKINYNIEKSLFLILSLLEEVHKDTTIKTIIEFAGDLPEIFANKIQLEEVLFGILNKVYASVDKEKGQVAVETEVKDNKILIRIKDNGQGYAPEEIQNIFTETKAKTGVMSLSEAYKIIESYGGKISLTSTVGKESEFEIQLPIAIAEETEKEEAAEQKIPEGTKGNVLIIDDEEMIVELVESMLTESNYIVDKALNADDGIAKLEKQDYNKVLIDLRMPGKNGFELYDWIKEKKPKLIDKIIFITGDICDADTRAFLEQTGAKCLYKPFNLESLLACV